MKFLVLIFCCFVSAPIFFSKVFGQSFDEEPDILSSRFLTLAGNVELKNISKENLNVAGRLIGSNLKCNTLKSSGFINIDGLEAQNISIAGDFIGKNINVVNAKLSGKIKIIQGYFNSIDIASEDPILENIKVSGDVFMKKQSNCKTQVLYLKNTTIEGNVIFEKEGIIQLSRKSKIVGNVVNAILEHE